MKDILHRTSKQFTNLKHRVLRKSFKNFYVTNNQFVVMNQLRSNSLQFNTENKGFPTNIFGISGRIDKGLNSTLCKKTTWKTSEEMEESVYIKTGMGQTGGSVTGTCWKGRRIQDMMTTMMMIMVNVVI